jgi:hypothetical protein
MLNYYSPFQSKHKNQQVNGVLFTPERYVGIAVKDIKCDGFNFERGRRGSLKNILK